MTFAIVTVSILTLLSVFGEGHSSHYCVNRMFINGSKITRDNNCLLRFALLV